MGVVRRLIATTLLSCVCVAAPAFSQVGGSLTGTQEVEVAWRESTSIGAPNRGALVNGVQLPAEGADHFTWDFPLGQSPNRGWRRWGTDGTVRVLLRVLAEYRIAHPVAPRVGIADLSRTYGGPFGRRFGGLGHASHQNGLDVDILYPRRDGLELAPESPQQINRRLAQDLVDRMVAARAQLAFVGPRTKLRGPKRVVQKLVHHDDHLHVRFRPRGALLRRELRP
jgi:murein endopeptidase